MPCGTPENPDLKRPTLLHYIVLCALVAAVFAPTCTFDFVRWDDTHNFTNNKRLQPPTWDSVAYYWRHPYKDLYIPVTYTLWCATAVIGYVPTHAGAAMVPEIFHGLNLIVHLISACAAMALLFRLVRDRWAALVGALVFALHPVQVESVAWASGLKDMLAGALGLIALYGYILNRERSDRRTLPLVLASLAYILAMLSKPSAVVLPLLAGVIELFWGSRTKNFRNWIVVLLWLLFAIPIMLIARHVQPQPDDVFVPPLWGRPLVGLDALAFYFKQLVLPIHLAIDYGRTPSWLWHSSQRYWTWLVPATLATIAIWVRRRLPLVISAMLLFALAPLPVLGLIPFDFQAYSTVSDHYLYLAMIGPALLVAALLAGRGIRIQLLVASLVVVVLGGRSLAQSFYWRDSESLFAHTVEVNPRSLAGNVNLGNLYSEAGQSMGNRALIEKAIDHYRIALEVAPDDAVTWFNLGNQYSMLRRWPDAAAAYERAIVSEPDYATAHAQLGWVMGQIGDWEGARRHYREALRIDPNEPVARKGLAELNQRRPTSLPSQSGAKAQSLRAFASKSSTR